ncbi:MAG: tRNA pseudouridine(38-40) synthase TruA, partial [Burkholderiales bacterium]|nr:tRNA pseudouridine(38-40) synthase TruA [Burkholderiales bacterium]
LILEYDGSKFHGWQRQHGVSTIQENLETALSKFANETISTITAGRTDTGVHALNQVVHFESNANRTLLGWVKGVNANLPETIRVKKVMAVNDEFDARFSATSRTYHYYLLNSSTCSAHIYNSVGIYHYALDIELMQKAANLLIGKHDFSSFRASSCQANTPIRQMNFIKIEKQFNMIRISLQANAFLHHMVRNIVGSLVYIGSNRICFDEFKDIFLSRSRKLSPPTFMPNGLYLVDVAYPDIEIANLEERDIWLYQR